MKKTFHIINCILSLLLAALGIVLIVLRGQMEDEGKLVFLLAGFFQTVMGLLAFLIGALLPEEGKKMSKRARKIFRVIAAIAMLGGKGTSGVAAYNALSGEVILQRFWEPAWPLAWLLFEGMFLWFYPAGGLLGAAVGLSAVLLILLIAGAFGWSVMYRRENGTFKWMFIILPSAFILIMFGLVFFFTYLEEQKRGETVSDTLAELRVEIEETLAEYNSGEHTAAAELEAEKLQMADIVTMLKDDIGEDQDIYYRWVTGGEDDVVSLVVWTAAGEEVYNYQFSRKEKTYSLITAFVSSALTKEDVEGKEDGVISG